jgi:hypothetical protein
MFLSVKLSMEKQYLVIPNQKERVQSSKRTFPLAAQKQKRIHGWVSKRSLKFDCGVLSFKEYLTADEPLL